MSVNFDGSLSSSFSHADITDARCSRAVSWSVLCFFRVENTAGDDRSLFTKWGSGVNKRQARFKVDAGTAPQNIQIDFQNTAVTINGGNNVELNTWYLFCVTADGADTVTLNLVGMDGTFLDSNVTGTTTVDSTDMSEDLRIGTRNSGADPMFGDIAYAAYLKREILQPEILEYLRNPAKVVHKVGGSTGPVFFLPMVDPTASTTPDWSGQGNPFTKNGSGHTDGDNPPVSMLYRDAEEWQGNFAAAAPSVFLRDPIMSPGIIPFAR